MRFAVVVALVLCVVGSSLGFTPPFTRTLSEGMNGTDVVILQNLIVRSPYVKTSVGDDGSYGSSTRGAVEDFQAGNKLPATGIADSATTSLLLGLHSGDGYVDSGVVEAGYMYKVVIPVYRNRSIMTSASLYDADMNLLHSYKVKTHGQNDPATGEALNMFSPDGATPTGLMEFDLNSPEPEPALYGPYPINRAVRALPGVDSNAAFLMRGKAGMGGQIRNGILQHSGAFLYDAPLPNSHGCVHGYLPDIQAVWQILVTEVGAKVRQNPYGEIPYPYTPQGLLSIYQVD